MSWQTRSLHAAAYAEGRGIRGWLTSRDHKRLGLLTIATSLVLFLALGGLALVMRAQLAQPDGKVINAETYAEFFTIHGSGMIYLVVTPIAIGLGVYLVPLQVGAPVIAAPRCARLGYWLYLLGAIVLLSGFLTANGAADSGWTAYTPLSDSVHSPGLGQDLWIAGAFLATVGQMLLSTTVLWTILRMRAPHMTMLRIPVFSWSMVVTALMVLMAFPSLLAALGMISLARIDPSLASHNLWNVGYQHLFWFYAHPVVYVMFFPFVGCVAEVIATFTGRRFFGYKGTAFALLAFAALSMSVWGHHMFATGQADNDYYSLTSTLLSIPAGLEYFGLIGTLYGARMRYRTPMLFALAFLPQFLIGGLTGVMLGTPALDVHVTDSFFVVAHFHYTLFAGSVFGLFAGLYYWFPKMTGLMYNERLGRLHFVLMVIGTNVTFLPMFALGYFGMPRRMASYPASAGFTTLNLVSSIGAFTLGLSMLVAVYNVFISFKRRVPAGRDPWEGQTLEWAAASPPTRFNFDPGRPLPAIHGFAPLLDERLERAESELAAGSGEPTETVLA